VSPAKGTVIPNFLTASTPRGLRRLMLLNNKKLNAWHNYQIMFVNGKWFAWYHAEVSRDLESIESVSGGGEE
jgi:hypothetical protein